MTSNKPRFRRYTRGKGKETRRRTREEGQKEERLHIYILLLTLFYQKPFGLTQKQPYGFGPHIKLKKHQLNAVHWMKSIEDDVGINSKSLYTSLPTLPLPHSPTSSFSLSSFSFLSYIELFEFE